MQNDTTQTLQVIHQSQWDFENDFYTDDIPTFDGKPELYFDCVLKLENTAAVTKQNPKDLALGKAQGTVIKCLKSLPADSSWNNVKAILRQDFFLIPTVTPAATLLINRFQQKGQCLQEFNIEFSKLIQDVTNYEYQDISDSLKIYMYAPKLFYPPISSKTIQHACPTLQKL